MRTRAVEAIVAVIVAVGKHIPELEDDRGAIEVVDVTMGAILTVGIIALAPIYYKFIGMASSEADPFSSLLLQLIPPFLWILLIVSLGRSARRSA